MISLIAYKVITLRISQFSSVSRSCLTLSDLMDWSMPGFPVHHQLPELTQTHVHRVSDAIHPTISSSVVPFSSHRQSLPALSNESVLHIRWPKYWSFSFSISPSNEYSGLISFRMDWLDLHKHNCQRFGLFTSIMYHKEEYIRNVINHYQHN